MSIKILLLGQRGKMGTALTRVLTGQHDLIGAGSRDFNAMDTEDVGALLDKHRPAVVINTVAFAGIDGCEAEPQAAFQLNTVLPRFLAERSLERGFRLVHFSTDAVFSDRGEGFYTEEDCPAPLNIYGLTKYGGDCFVQSIARDYYILRISILFGPTQKGGQFVEKMLRRIADGQKQLRIADDIIASPTYNLDVALRLSRMLQEEVPPGLYHVVNEGRASLWELMREVSGRLGLDVSVEKASYKDFPSRARKNTCTPLRSVKAEPLRPWREAVRDCYGG